MYIDLLTKIKNAQKAKLTNVKMPFSNSDMAVAELLMKHAYVESVEKKGRMPKRIIDVKLKYNDGAGAISGIELLSKPSRRLYSGYKTMPGALQGYGHLIISTSKGIMTGAEAKKQKLGGVILFKIW